MGFAGRSIDGIGMTSLRTRMRMVERLHELGIQDEVVLKAMLDIPRHWFVDEALSSRAYDDVSLPINYGQTISRPYTVARMIEILRKDAQINKVYEVGTGCGYQAAVLSKVFAHVYSVERIQSLYMRARRHLHDLKISNVNVRFSDGRFGLPDVAPFDGIVLAAAAPEIPEYLCQQLSVGGRMVLPIGNDQEQWLYLVERSKTAFHTTKMEPVKFVPLLIGKVVE